MKQKENRKWSLKQRALAMTLILVMLLTSSGMQILAKEIRTNAVSAETAGQLDEAVTEKAASIAASDASEKADTPETATSEKKAESKAQTMPEETVTPESTVGSEMVTSGSAVPDMADTETTAPDTAVSVTVKSETTGSEAEATETTESDVSAPEAAAPETTVSDETGSEAAAPETTEPDGTDSVAATPGTTVSDDTGSEAAGAGTTVPDTAASEASSPETTEADETTPNTTVSETAVPNTTVPETADLNTIASEEKDTEVNEQTDTAMTPDISAVIETELPEEAQTEALLEEDMPTAVSEEEQEIDLAPYITGGSMKITIDGIGYTIGQIHANGWTVPQGAPVEVNLQYGQITGVAAGAVLYYQIPTDMVTGIYEKHDGSVMDGDTVAGTYTISTAGLVRITLNEAYLAVNREPDGTTVLKGGQFSFEGHFSSERGETPGDNDNVIRFGTVEFTIPFEYANYYGDVDIEKNGSFDPAARLIRYTVTVKTPDDNTMDAKNISVTDTITAGMNFIEQNNGSYYRNVTVSSGQFDTSSGVWTIGTMAPGQEAVLTYYMKVSDAYFSDSDSGAIANNAVVHFNQTGEKSASTSEIYNNILNIEKLNHDGKLTTDENGNTCLVYTVTVTAPAGNDCEMTDITVEDVFGTGKAAISGYQNVTVSQGNTQQNDAAAAMDWFVGSLQPGESATLEYQAVIDPEIWASGSGTEFSTTVQNTATVKVNGISYDDASTETKLTKKWVTKNGETVTEGEYAGGIRFTIRANSDENGAPILNNVLYFTDQLSGTFEYVGTIELTGYTSAANGEVCVSESIPIADVLNEDGSGWTLDLRDDRYAGLQGPYYYELVYYVMPKAGSSNRVIKNEAGIGVQQGANLFDHTASWTGSGSNTFSYSKEYLGGLGTGESAWRTTIPTDIPAGASYTDWPNPTHFNSSMVWFTQENIESIRVMFQGKELERGTGEGDGDYYVAAKWKGDQASEFTIQFNRSITGVSSANPVTIEYDMHIDPAKFPPVDNDSASHYTVVNLSSLTLYGITQTARASAVYETRVELKKTAGTYDKTAGTMTWTLEVNRGSSINGDAVILEELPEGLSFVGAEIISRGAKAGNTELGEPTDENGNAITEDTSTVRIPVTGLYLYSDRTDKNQVSDGMITVQVTTRVKDDELLTLNGTKTYTNKATLLADGLEVSRTASQQITGTVLGKTGVHNTNTYPYVKYTLTVNPDGLNLLAHSDTITVVDEMTAAMRLAIEKSDYFVVTSNGEDITSWCTLVDHTNTDDPNDTSGVHTFELTVPDDRPVTVEYYVAVNGVEGEEVTIVNRAHYEGQDVIPGAEESRPIVIQASSASVSTGVRFSLLKMDQSRNPVSDVKFALYRVELDSDGSALLDGDGLPVLTKVQEAVTAKNGKISFGSDLLEKEALYCYIETEAPAGYVIDARRHYVEFTKHENTGISGIVSIVNDATLAVTNQFAGTDYQIPAEKKINGGSSLASTKEFSFTLVPADGNTSWTDETCETSFESGTASVTGAGQITFDTLYFNAAGTYLYILTEDGLTAEDALDGYTKDDSTYQIKIVVGTDETNALAVTSAVFWKQGETTERNLSEAVPVFDNTYQASGAVELAAVKKLTGSLLQEGQFTFELKASDGSILQTKQNEKDGTVMFDALEYSESDIDQVFTYTVSEADTGAEGVTYSKAVYTVQVTVTDNSDGTLTTETEITTENHSVTEMLFENSFEGSVTLKKSGPDQEILSDVSFALYQKTEEGWSLYTADREDGIYTTDEAGLLKVTGLAENEYYFTEVAAPDGYITALGADGSSRIYSFRIGMNAPDAVVDAQLEVINEKTRVEIVKQDEEGIPVAGAVLRLVDSEGRTIDEWTTDGTSHVLEGILIGGQTYRLMEIGAPEGYMLAETITFTVKTDGATDPIIMVDQKEEETEMANEEPAETETVKEETAETETAKEEATETETVKEETAETETAKEETAETETVKEEAASGRAQITKYLTMLGNPISADDTIFYVALYEDAKCTRRVTEIKELEFRNASSAAVTFQNLEIGKKYYVGETDANGTVIRQGTLETGELFMAEFAQGQELTVKEDGTAELSFENQFFTLPAGFYMEGELTITKKLLGTDGKAKKSDETFYAGIFEDASFEHLSETVSESIVAISLEGASEASATVQVSIPNSGESILYVTEVDETGTPVAGTPGFQYQVTVSKTEIIITSAAYKAEVIITNREVQETEPETELGSEPGTGLETNPETEPDTGLETNPESEPDTELETNPESESDTRPKTELDTEPETHLESDTIKESVKTGDSTPIEIYMILFAVSAILLLIIEEKHRYHRNTNQ